MIVIMPTSLYQKIVTTKKYLTPKSSFPILVAVSLLSISGILFASTPSPGHPWREVGDGWWAATGTTAYRTFTFPDASSTVLTDNALVTIAQGGTNSNSTSTAMNTLSGLTTKGDMSIHNGTKHERLPIGTNGYVLTASSSQSTGVAWAPAVTPPAGSNTEVQFNDNSSLGSASAFTFDKTNSTLGLNGEVNFTAQSDPPASAAGTLNVYAKTISGRTMLKAIGSAGVNYAYQPSFFQNSIFIISTGGTTAYNTIGNTVTSVGTISHVVSEPLGYMANQVTAGTANATAGTGSNTAPYFIGSQVGSNGFFFQARMAFPDATSTGIRAFVGFTSGTMAASVSADNPAGSGVGWHYSTSAAYTGWKFMTDNGTTMSTSSTMLPFQQNAVFDFFIYCPPYPNNGTIYYRIDNLTASTTAEGSTSTTLPAGTTALRAGFQINNIAASARNVRLSRLYVETDR
jgi:hypothetical protein